VTGAGSGKELWDDERLAAAYRAAFEVTAPSGLEDRVAKALASDARPGHPGPRWLRWSGASAVAAAAVVVIAAVVLTSNGIPTGSPAASHAAESATAGAPETPTGGSPSTIFGADVLTVPQAIEVRDQLDDSFGEHDIVVAGWYQQPPPIHCQGFATGTGSSGGDCTVEYQWLIANPEWLFGTPPQPLTLADPTGPAIRAVFEDIDMSWALASAAEDPRQGPTPVVFVGHFGVVRGASCTESRIERCRERFVVDQVSWVDGAAYDAVFPADVDGIPVRSVEKVLEDRDAGELHGIAVAIGGWYAADPVTISCPIVPKAWNLFDRTCATSRLVADIPQLANRDRAIVGTGLRPVFAPLWTTRVPAEEPQGPVVLVGHFQDPLARSCRVDDQRACAGTFVIDRVAWIDGEPLGPRVPPPGFVLPQPAVTQQLFDVARLVREELAADGTVQSMTVLEAQDLASLDPTAIIDLDARAVIWYVRAVEAGTNRIGSFIVDDATGELIWSAFPMPAIVVP